MAEWFYVSKDQAQVGTTQDEIPHLISTEVLDRSTLMWKQGMLDWESAEKVIPDLLRDAAAALDGEKSIAPALPYQPQVQQSQVPQAPVTDGASLASLICGIVALITAGCYVGILVAIPAVILGHIGLRNCRVHQKRQGRILAVFGLVLGYLSIGFVLLITLYIVIMATVA